MGSRPARLTSTSGWYRKKCVKLNVRHYGTHKLKALALTQAEAAIFNTRDAASARISANGFTLYAS